MVDDQIKVTHDNNGRFYRIKMDLAKEGSELWDLTPYFKGRVGDNRFGLQVVWTNQGRLLDTTGMKPYIEGNVGNYSFDDKKYLQLAPDAATVRYTGNPSDCQSGGRATYYFPEQMFPRDGIFKGYIGLLDDRDDSSHPHISGVTVWFRVLPGIAQMGHACDVYISDLDKALQNFKVKLDQHDKDYQTQLQQVIDDARNAYESETKNAHDSLDALKAQIQANRDEQQKLSQHLAGTEQQIEINDVITRNEFNQLSNQLTQQVSQMRQSGLEFFDNADKLKSTYPDGANKLCVTLNDSHQYIYDYANKQWTDAGAFNYGTIDPKLTQNIYANDPDNLILNSDFHGLDMWNSGRDATAPNVYIDTSDAINGSNVAVMNGYIKDGSSNWSFLTSQVFPVDLNKHPNISFAADIWVTGINTEAGDKAYIELDMLDKNNNRTNWLHKLNNSSDFQRIAWKNLILPKDTVKCSIAFTMCGLGQYKIRRPQVNYGTDTVPYSKAEMKKSNPNLLANDPITEWNYSNGSKHFLIDNVVTYHSYPTLHITNDDSENYYFPVSPMIKVDKGAVISLTVPFRGTRNITNSKIYVEVDQYDDYNSKSSTRYNTAWLNPDADHFKELILNNIKLADTTKYIDIRFVTYGVVDVYVGNISLYQGKYTPKDSELANDFIASKNQFAFYPIANWSINGLSSNDMVLDYSVLDNQDKPTLKIKTPANRQFGQGISAYCANSNSTLKVKSKRFSFKFQYRQNIDFKKGYLEIIIRQYSSNQEQFNQSKQINLLLPNSKNLREIEFDNILLESDTKYIDVGFYSEGCVDANFSNFEQIPNPNLEPANLIGKFNPSTWFLNNYEQYPALLSVTRTNNYIELSSKITDDNYLILYTTPFDAKPNSEYTISIPASTNYDSSNNEVYLEVEKGTTPDEAAGHKVLTLFRFDEKSDDKTNIFKFKTDENTKYINFKLVIHKSAYAKFGIISLYQGDINTDDQNNIHSLPQLNIKSDGSITDKWQVSAFEFEDGKRKVTGYLQYAMQGDSSRNYPKKNLKLKFFKDSDLKTKLKWKPKAFWDKNSKFNLKANWIDATQARNLVNAKIFAKATEISPLSFSNQSNLFKSQNAGQMEGFPIELHFNGNYYGLMTFNTKKDDKPFGLDSDNPANEAIEFENSSSGLSSKDDQLDGTNYATIVQDKPSDELKTNFHNLVNFINTANDDDFKAKIGNYIDVKSVFNCILWGLYSSMWDFVKKSMILLTWDSGKTFYLTLYDMDSTWNLFWDGSKLTTEDVFDFNKPDKVLVAWGNNFYNRIYKLFKPELQKQWNYLRANVWRNDQIAKSFKDFINSIPEEAYEREQAKWPNIPSKKITDYNQIQQSIITRGNAMDNFMEHLTDSQPTSPVPQPTTPQAQPASGTTPTTPQAQPNQSNN